MSYRKLLSEPSLTTIIKQPPSEARRQRSRHLYCMFSMISGVWAVSEFLHFILKVCIQLCGYYKYISRHTKNITWTKLSVIHSYSSYQHAALEVYNLKFAIFAFNHDKADGKEYGK